MPHIYLPQAYPLWFVWGRGKGAEPTPIIAWRIDTEDGRDGVESPPRPVTSFGVHVEEVTVYTSIEDAKDAIKDGWY